MSLPIMAAFLPALGWVLLYFVWQGLLIGGAAAVGLWLLRDAGPQPPARRTRLTVHNPGPWEGPTAST